VEDPTTIALNLTFFGTLGVAFVMFLGLFLVFIATLVIAGVGRLATVLVMAMFGRLPGEDTVDVVRLPAALAPQPAITSEPAGTPENEAARKSTEPASATAANAPSVSQNLKRIPGILRTAMGNLPLIGTAHRPPAEMAADWADAVARADARAVARARAEKPAITVTAPDFPPAGGLPEKVMRVAPLVESVLDHRPADRSAVPIPRSFKRPAPGTEDLLDTGSLVSLAARPKSESVR
jgi:hypothetical protein